MATTARYGYNGNHAGEQLLSFCSRARRTLISRLGKPAKSILEDEQAWADHFAAIKRINGTPKIDRNKTQRKDAEGKRVQRHGDFAIGLLLGHYAMKRDVAPIEFTGVPASSGRWSDNPSTRRDDDDDDARDTDSGAW